MDLEWRSGSSKLMGSLWSWEPPAPQLVKASACVVLATPGEKVGSGPHIFPQGRENTGWQLSKLDIIQDFSPILFNLNLKKKKKKEVEERGADQRNECTVDSRVQVWRRSLFLERDNSYAIRDGPCVRLTCVFVSQRHTKTSENFQILVLGFPPHTLFSPLVPVLTTVNQTK